MRINGEKYKVYRDELDKYTRYLYNNELFDRAPYDTRVVGYIKDGRDRIAICKKINHRLNKTIYGGTVVSGVLVFVFAIGVFNMKVEIPEWTQKNFERDELDDGVVKASSKLSYSSYATYDGENVQLYVSSKKNADVALKFGDQVTDFVNVKDSYSIPLDLGINAQEVASGLLLYKVGDDVTEYPLVVEYPLLENIELAVGTDYDAKKAYEQITQHQDTTSMLAEPEVVLTEDLKSPPPPDTDWENFEVIQSKSEESDDEFREIHNSEMDVLNR